MQEMQETVDIAGWEDPGREWQLHWEILPENHGQSELMGRTHGAVGFSPWGRGDS